MRKKKTNLEAYIGKTLDQMTQEDWDKVEDAIENFSGKRANMQKIRRFLELKKIASQMEKVKSAGVSEPSPNKMHAGIFLDCPRWMSLSGDNADRFVEMCKLADEFSFAAPDTRDPDYVGDGGFRLSFFLYDVWESEF